MNISKNTIERICKIFDHLNFLEKQGIQFISSNELGKAMSVTADTVRKDISFLGVVGHTNKGYDVHNLKNQLSAKLFFSQNRKACIVGLGRLGTALLDYEKFQEDGFEIVAGFDCSINKIERIRTHVDVFPVNNLEAVVKERGIELGIITVPPESARAIADKLCHAGVKGILNFSPVKIIVPDNVVYLDMDFTSALRFIAAQFTLKN